MIKYSERYIGKVANEIRNRLDWERTCKTMSDDWRVNADNVSVVLNGKNGKAVTVSENSVLKFGAVERTISVFESMNPGNKKVFHGFGNDMMGEVAGEVIRLCA